MKKKFEYNLNSHAVYGSFDYGEVMAENEKEAMKLAIEDVIKNVREMNKALEGTGHNIEVDFDGLTVDEVFDFKTTLRHWGMNFGDECNGLLFNFDGSNNIMTLRFPPSVLDGLRLAFGEVYFEVRVYRDTLNMSMYINDKFEEDFSLGFGKIPQSSPQFNDFTKFLIGQLCTIQSKFAQVDECILDTEKMEYTVHGFLIPRQTIKFEDYEEWNSIGGVVGAVFDCQIDEELVHEPETNGGKSSIYTFQIVDLGYDVDEGNFTLNDTPMIGGGFIHRDYQDIQVVFAKELEVVHHGLLKTIEVREFKIGDSLYEVVIDCEGGRDITNIHAEKGEVTPQIMEALQNAVEKIEI